MAFVSITQLHLQSWRYLPAFFQYALPSRQQAIAAPGNLFTTTRQQGLLTFWTITIWESEAAMRQYMVSGAHRAAMPKLVQWCDRASTLHWHQEGAELPDWNTIQARMMAEGRPYPMHGTAKSRDRPTTRAHPGG